ncbi:YggS family pyridoxal phosphate-dependent enzyme [Flavobacteriaceae bacterium]|nr:YggS family pyridoxal phosphate-dependent enzyme [Flavobacteriaceae bacterium]MDB4590853.1 YggS family pyridoxal phosphate-dependent enzyme [Flavobacteriaceae bacterium]
MSIKYNLENINLKISSEVCLVAVSKTKPISDILEAYDCGQRVFGENKIQELVEKHKKLPKDIEWHMIGHIQRNKVKYMAPFISLIHSADSYRLIKEINKQGKINNRVINCLLQIKIASEESKFGFTETEATNFLNSDEYVSFKNIKIVGLMGMATFTEDQKKIDKEFNKLKIFYEKVNRSDSQINILSMGMSDDYPIAIHNGSNMVRIGSSIFGKRNYIKK